MKKCFLILLLMALTIPMLVGCGLSTSQEEFVDNVLKYSAALIIENAELPQELKDRILALIDKVRIFDEDGIFDEYDEEIAKEIIAIIKEGVKYFIEENGNFDKDEKPLWLILLYQALDMSVDEINKLIDEFYAQEEVPEEFPEVPATQPTE